MARLLRSGEVDLFCSEGLTEAMNDDRKEFGDARVLEVLEQYLRSTTARIQGEILKEVKRFSGSAEQNDDITLVVVRSE
ncbi:MAG: SpoIIE family protein phosphatase [Bacteroidota bacterium]